MNKIWKRFSFPIRWNKDREPLMRLHWQRFYASSSSLNRESTDETKNIAVVYHNVISPQEELSLVKYLHPILAARKYESAHWDAVISQYKEIELSSSYRLPPDISDLFERMRNFIREKCQLDTNSPFLSPHVIDLAEDGSIGKLL